MNTVCTSLFSPKYSYTNILIDKCINQIIKHGLENTNNTDYSPISRMLKSGRMYKTDRKIGSLPRNSAVSKIGKYKKEHKCHSVRATESSYPQRPNDILPLRINTSPVSSMKNSGPFKPKQKSSSEKVKQLNSCVSPYYYDSKISKYTMSSGSYFITNISFEPEV